MANLYEDFLFDTEGFATLSEVQSLSSTKGALYLFFTFTDPIYGTLTFYIGDQRFIATNVHGGPPVYPAVMNWGVLRKVVAPGGGQVSELAIELVANAVVCPSDQADLRFRVYELLQKTALRDVAVSIWQWNAYSSVQEQIWSGYWGGTIDSAWQHGIQTITVRARSDPKSSQVMIGDVLDAASYPSAPPNNFGRMVGRAYGSMKQTIPVDGLNVGFHPVMFGYPMPGVPALYTDKTPGGTSVFTRAIFSEADGTTANGAITTETLEVSVPYAADVFAYLPEINSYAVIATNSLSSSQSDSTSARTDIFNSPTLYVIVRPTEVVTTPASTTPYALIDDDASNYVSLPNTGDEIKFKVPGLSLTSAVIDSLFVAIDADGAVSSAPSFDFGIWNPNQSGGANWWGGSTKKATTGAFPGRGQTFSGDTGYANGKYTIANSSDAKSQFQNGRFVGLDGSSNEVPVQLKVARIAGGSGSLHIHGMTLIIKLTYPLVKAGMARYLYLQGQKKQLIPYENFIQRFKDYGPGSVIGGGEQLYKGAPEAPNDLIPFLQIDYQKDDGSGTYSGTAASTIKKVPDILRHLLQKVGGFSTNGTASTLGNFIDARTEVVTDEKIAACQFGNDPIDVLSVVDQIQSRWPGRVYEKNGVRQFIGDDMNPDPSRLYRSSADVVRISAKRHIVDGDVRIQELDPRGILNRVILNYGHGVGNGRAQGTVQYDNPLSQEYFPTSLSLTVDEPWALRADVMDGTPPAATFLAKWYGRRSARPRLIVTVLLSQAFYDLERGHVLEFDDDMEDIGIYCPAFRCGLPDYAFARTNASATNQADDTTPLFIPAGTTSRTVWGASYRPRSMDIHVTDSSSYTQVNNGWKYWDGSAWTVFSNVACSDAGDPDTVFGRIGDFTLSWDEVLATDWPKDEIDVNGALKGPCYWWGLEYTSSVDSANGTGITTIPATWRGRSFEVLEVSRTVGGVGRYPAVKALLQEVM